MWGYFLYQGVMDPLGGINSLWPLFGISNQLLAAVALGGGHNHPAEDGPARWVWVTLVPMAWLVIITMTASYQKIFDANPRWDFYRTPMRWRRKSPREKFPAAKIADTQRVIFNQRLDAVVTAVLAGMIIVLIVEALVQWYAFSAERRSRYCTRRRTWRPGGPEIFG